MKAAVVNILSLPYHVNNDYTYLLGRDIADGAEVGRFVTVSFGNANKPSVGVIRSLCEVEEVTVGMKYVIGIYDKVLSLSEELLKLCEYISDTTFCSFGEAAKVMIPAILLKEPDECYTVCKKLDTSANETTKVIYAYIAARKKAYLSAMRVEFGKSVSIALNALEKLGYIEKEILAKDAPKTGKTYFYKLAADEQYAMRQTRSISARHAITYLHENGEAEKNVLKEITRISDGMIEKMCSLGIFSVRVEEKLKNPYANFERSEFKCTLSDEQQQAFEKIDALCRKRQPAAVLLHGVTGSGKTQVIKSVCDSVISMGRSVIMLVPEISLTPQSVKIFCAAYGDRVVVIHSGLSAGERADAYRKIKNGMADMVIGTRSAIFAPLDNIGAIIIDEEQEHTYRSEMTPKYHARDIARFRCNAHNAVMLLSSATPSIESYYKAQTGKYQLVKLTQRYGKAQLPQVVVADLREDYSAGSTDAIGAVLKNELVQTKNRGEQSVLFLNRRGYSNFLSCRMCGEVIMCPHCDVSLTYHTTSRLVKYNAEQEREDFLQRKKNGYLLCHYCGYRIGVPETCPKCGSAHIAYMGHGTQKICQDIEEYGYGISVLRMDADTTSKKFSHDKILSDFRQHKADVLLGTQMVTKGHDFPDVTLVGVILADSSLYTSDYHSSEQTFSLLTQVVGRAGRAEKKGIAVIQTFSPDNEIINLASKQDYESFYKGEIALRHALKFPPFCDIAVFLFTSTAEPAMFNCTTEFYNLLTERLKGEYSDVKLQIFGPIEAPVYRLNGRWRMQLIVKCRMNKRTRALFSNVLKDYAKRAPSKVTVSINVNPTSIG